MKVSIHSISDAITNSSTTIYMWASSSAIANTKKFFNQILKAAGIEKTSDELFNFKIHRPDMDYDDFEETYIDEYPDKTEADAKAAYVRAKADDAAKPEWWGRRPYSDWPSESNVIVTTKDDSSISFDMLAYVKSIFEMDAERDG